MFWKTLIACVVGVSLSVPAWAEPEEEFPEGPGGEEEALPESDEEEMAEEEVDHMAMLESIIGKMKDAEEHLAKASSWRATDAQGNVVEDLDKMMKAADLQKKAIQEMDRIFGGSRDNQQKAIEEIEKLIKLAKEGS